ncbi:unnamed protein product, partial [Discosporangium mesarthrocarpum]
MPGGCVARSYFVVLGFLGMCDNNIMVLFAWGCLLHPLRTFEYGAESCILVGILTWLIWKRRRYTLYDPQLNHLTFNLGVQFIMSPVLNSSALGGVCFSGVFFFMIYLRAYQFQGL